MDRRRILVVAGSDSSGGAGLEADQKVIAAHGCYAMTATTALTAQNTQGVYGIHHTPPDFVKMQIEACIDDIGVDVVKIGMLASAETIQVVADALRKYNRPLSVVDPVMVSTSGAQLLPDKALRCLREELLPLATLSTPNIPEARLLLQDSGQDVKQPECLDDIIALAKAVRKLGSSWVLVKGGHLPLTRNHVVSSTPSEKDIVVDVLYDGSTCELLETTHLSSKNTHGTGCSLASAIASNLALGLKIPQAVRSATHYVEAGIRGSIDLGKGNGPINHFHSNYMLPFPPGRFIDYLLHRAEVQEAWREHTEHEFVNRLADGSLPVENFKYYLIQDYLYLVQFARANALAAYKANNIDDISASAKIVLHIEREMALHLGYCKDFGLSKEDVEREDENQACTAYTRYMLDVGQSEDWLALQVCFAPCLIGYGVIARRLYDDPKTVRTGNIYWKWIENYTDKDYTTAVDVGSDLLERYAVKQSPSRIEALVKVFIHATRMETGFWDMGSGNSKTTR